MPFHLTVLLAAAMSYAVLRMVVQAWRSLLAAPRVDTLSAAPVGDAGARRDDAPARRSGDLSAPDLSRVARVEAGPMGHAAGVALLWGGGDPHVRIESAAASTADAWLRPVASDATDSDFDAEVSSDAAPVQSTDIDNRYRSINSRRSRLPLQWISRHRVRRFGQLFAVLLALPLLSGCATLNHGMLAAGGPVMDQERRLFLIVGFVMLFVIGPVLLLTPIFAWHYRLSNTKSAYRPEWGFSWSLEFLIWIPPTIIVIILGFFLWNYTHALDPYKPLASDKPALRVQAVSLDWKWLFIYPDEGVATINDLVFPADRPVHLYLTSGTVMQSLLLPQLAGQIYAMAGMTTELNFAANAPGEFRGENVQYSGDGFPHEKFPIHALSSGDYDKWLADTRADKRSLDLAGYKHLVTVREPAEPQVFGSVASNLFQSAVNQNMPGVRSADMDKKNTMDGMSMKDMK